MKDGIAKFENLEVWKEGIRLSINIFKEVDNFKSFGLRDQMIRSSLSIPSNIAEGYDRDSQKEFIRFLNIAKASCSELRTQLYLCKETGLIAKEKCNDYIDKTRKISAMIYKLIMSIKSKE